MQSATVPLTEVLRTTASTSSHTPRHAFWMEAPSSTVPRPARTRRPTQRPSGSRALNVTGSASLPRATSVPSTTSSTRSGSTPDRVASSLAASTSTPGSMVSVVPQATVTSPWRM